MLCWFWIDSRAWEEARKKSVEQDRVHIQIEGLSFPICMRHGHRRFCFTLFLQAAMLFPYKTPAAVSLMSLHESTRCLTGRIARGLNTASPDSRATSYAQDRWWDLDLVWKQRSKTLDES